MAKQEGHYMTAGIVRRRGQKVNVVTQRSVDIKGSKPPTKLKPVL